MLARSKAAVLFMGVILTLLLSAIGADSSVQAQGPTELTDSQSLSGEEILRNVKMMRFQTKACVLHVWREGNTNCSWDQTKMPWEPLFGFELIGFDSAEKAQAFIDSEEHTLTLSVDGRTPFSIKEYYQPAFEAVPGQGPRWSWDHTGDGLTDPDHCDPKFCDFVGPIVFFRYPGQTHFGAERFDFHLQSPTLDLQWTYIMSR